MKSRNPTNNLTYYDEEMEQCAEEYAQYCSSVVEDAKKICKDPVVLIEQKLDFPSMFQRGSEPVTVSLSVTVLCM